MSNSDYYEPVELSEVDITFERSLCSATRQTGAWTSTTKELVVNIHVSGSNCFYVKKYVREDGEEPAITVKRFNDLKESLDYYNCMCS